MLDIYLVQMEVLDGQKAKNFDTVRRLTSEIRKLPEDPVPGLIILPEMFATGYLPLHPEKSAEDFSTYTSGDTTIFLSRLANITGCTVMGAGISQAANGDLFNHTSVYNPGAQTETACYDKCHPFFIEQSKISAGHKVNLFKIRQWKVAPTICFDLRFPELYREAVKQGAQLATIQAAWPEKRIHHWKTLLQARAIENQMYIAAVNYANNLHETRRKNAYGGCSMIVNPQGEIMEAADDREQVICARIYSKPQEQYRQEFPVLNGIV